MTDLFFFIRMIVVTVFLVIVLQVKLGAATVEEHLRDWARQSVVMGTLDDVAAGAVAAMGRAYQSAVNMIDAKINSRFDREQIAGARATIFRLGRSDAFKKDEERKAAQAPTVAPETDAEN